MLLKKQIVSPAVCAVLLAGMAFAGQKATPPQRGGKKNAANAENSATPVKRGASTEPSTDCQSIRTQLNELTAQERQLHERARADESQRVSYLEQAKQVEAQRVALERTEIKGRDNRGIESEVRAKEQQRIGFEHQAEEISRQRDELEKQADEVGRQRRSLEEEHRVDCHLHTGKTSTVK